MNKILKKGLAGLLIFLQVFSTALADPATAGFVLSTPVVANGAGTQPIFSANLQTSLIPEKATGSGTPTYTRNLAAYATDFEGRLVSVPANAARMQGTRVVRNLIPAATANSNAWTGTYYTGGYGSGGTGSVPVVTANYSANPIDGATTASRLVLDHGAGNTSGDYSRSYNLGVSPAPTGHSWRRTTWIKSNTASSYTITWGGNTSILTLTITPTWKRFDSGVIGAEYPDLIFRGNLSVGVAVADLSVYADMTEDVTGQTNQNPSEYVSVGVLSAPYHGLGIDGIKSFGTLNGNTVASNVVTEATGAAINSSTAKFGVLPGVAGSYFSTPHSAATDITSDIDIRVRAELDDWTPAATMILVGRYQTGSAADTYTVSVRTDGKLGFLHVNSTTVTEVLSDASVSAANGTAVWVRVTWKQSTGKINYYQSQDAVTWAQVGSPDVAGPTTALNAGTRQVALGTLSDGTSFPLQGNIYRAQIYNGIGPTNVTPSGTGTLAVDFNPNNHTSGATFNSATTLEQWTINGNAKIFGSNSDATYGIPAQWDASGPKGLLTEGSAQNLVLHSVMDSGWDNAGSTATVTLNNAVAPDGTLTAATVASIPNGFIFLGGPNTGVSPAGKSYNLAFFVKGSGTFTGRLTNGVDQTFNQQFTATSNWQQLNFTTSAAFNGTAGNLKPVFHSAGGDTATSLTFWIVNVAQSSISSSPITTAAAAVTRPADVLTYPAPGNIASVMTVADSITPTTVLGTTEVKHFGTYFDASNSTEVVSGTTTNLVLQSQTLGTTWGTNNVSVSPDTTIAPDGTLTADTLTSTGTSQPLLQQSITVPAVLHTLSGYLKKGTDRYIGIKDNLSGADFAVFDLQNGVVTDNGASYTNIKITADLNGFWRVQVSFTGAGAGSYRIYFMDNQATGYNPTITTASGLTTIPWGFQLETGSNASFYKPTTVAASTVTALVARKRISGINHEAWTPITRTVGTTQKYAARFDSSGIQIALNGVLGTADATGTAAQIGSTFQIGGDGNGGGQDYCTHRFEKASTRGLPDAVIVSMSS